MRLRVRVPPGASRPPRACPSRHMGTGGAMTALVEPFRGGSGISRQRMGERTCVITADGRFTSRLALSFSRELAEARNEGCTDFVFDFCAVASVDSIAAMIFAEQRLELEDCAVVIAAQH